MLELLLMIKEGAHCNGISPLMDAACNGHLDIVTVLVDKGAQLGLKDANVRFFS